MVLLNHSPLLKKTRVRQAALDKWFPLNDGAARSGSPPRPSAPPTAPRWRSSASPERAAAPHSLIFFKHGSYNP